MKIRKWFKTLFSDPFFWFILFFIFTFACLVSFESEELKQEALIEKAIGEKVVSTEYIENYHYDVKTKQHTYRVELTSDLKKVKSVYRFEATKIYPK